MGMAAQTQYNLLHKLPETEKHKQRDVTRKQNGYIRINIDFIL